MEEKVTSFKILRDVYIKDNNAGGNLHIISDDNNIMEDSSLLFCKEKCFNDK